MTSFGDKHVPTLIPRDRFRRAAHIVRRVWIRDSGIVAIRL
jgi:hypothetical protein